MKRNAETDAPTAHYFDCGNVAQDDVMASEPFGIDCPICLGWLVCTCSVYFGCSEYADDCPRHGIEARLAAHTRGDK